MVREWLGITMVGLISPKRSFYGTVAACHSLLPRHVPDPRERVQDMIYSILPLRTAREDLKEALGPFYWWSNTCPNGRYALMLQDPSHRAVVVKMCELANAEVRDGGGGGLYLGRGGCSVLDRRALRCVPSFTRSDAGVAPTQQKALMMNTGRADTSQHGNFMPFRNEVWMVNFRPCQGVCMWLGEVAQPTHFCNNCLSCVYVPVHVNPLRLVHRRWMGVTR